MSTAWDDRVLLYEECLGHRRPGPQKKTVWQIDMRLSNLSRSPRNRNVSETYNETSQKHWITASAACLCDSPNWPLRRKDPSRRAQSTFFTARMAFPEHKSGHITGLHRASLIPFISVSLLHPQALCSLLPFCLHIYTIPRLLPAWLTFNIFGMCPLNSVGSLSQPSLYTTVPLQPRAD